MSLPPAPTSTAPTSAPTSTAPTRPALTSTARALPVRLAAHLHARHAGAHHDREAGMTTAEYAVGTVAAVGFGGVLYKVITSSQVSDLLRGVVSEALQVSF